MTADTASPSLREYTPPMSRLRIEYLAAIAYFGFADRYAAEWDRAIAAHDAEVARKAAEKAWGEGWEFGNEYAISEPFDPRAAKSTNPYRVEQIGGN